MSGVKAVLFDLDGTLIDSAPDLGAAANRLRAQRGLPDLPLLDYRAWAGSGARGMLKVGFGLTPDAPEFEPLKQAFFDEYERGLAERTVVFDGILPMLDTLSQRGLKWGIVTNKMERFALPLLAQLPALAGAACVIGGDTTAHPKPHPEPLFEACRRAGLAPQDCVYVGDDLRDIQAGRAAGMRTVAVTYGYLGFGQDANTWSADAVLDSPQALVNWLGLA